MWLPQFSKQSSVEESGVLYGDNHLRISRDTAGSRIQDKKEDFDATSSSVATFLDDRKSHLTAAAPSVLSSSHQKTISTEKQYTHHLNTASDSSSGFGIRNYGKNLQSVSDTASVYNTGGVANTGYTPEARVNKPRNIQSSDLQQRTAADTVSNQSYQEHSDLKHGQIENSFETGYIR